MNLESENVEKDSPFQEQRQERLFNEEMQEEGKNGLINFDKDFFYFGEPNYED